jgi:hypothetical protein
MEKAATLLTFGYVIIVQVIATGELGYVPISVLVDFGLAVGVCMVAGSSYALLTHGTSFRVFDTMKSAFQAIAPRGEAATA